MHIFITKSLFTLWIFNTHQMVLLSLAPKWKWPATKDKIFLPFCCFPWAPACSLAELLLPREGSLSASETGKLYLKYGMFHQELQLNEHSIKSIPENRLGLILLPAAGVLWEKQSCSLPSHGCCSVIKVLLQWVCKEQLLNDSGSANTLAVE